MRIWIVFLEAECNNHICCQCSGRKDIIGYFSTKEKADACSKGYPGSWVTGVKVE